MLAVSVSKPDSLEIVEVPDPTPGPYQAKVRTELASICNMTDRKVVEGHFPGIDSYPLLLGHETVGIVEEVGEKVRNFKVGDRVVGGLVLNTPDPAFGSGWGGFCGYTLAGDHLAMVEDGVADEAHNWFEVYEIMRTVPQSISVEDAVMLCTWREVYSAFADFNIKAGDDLLIYGDGPVGLSFVKFGRLLGLNDIYLVGKYDEKLQMAMAMGATTTFKPDAPELASLVEERGKPLDAIVDGVGKEDIINAAVPMIRMGGSIGVYGVIDAPSITLHHGRGPYNFDLHIHQWPTRSGERAAQEPIVKLIEDGKLSYEEFLSGEFPVAEVEKAYDFSKVKETVKTFLRY